MSNRGQGSQWLSSIQQNSEKKVAFRSWINRKETLVVTTSDKLKRIYLQINSVIRDRQECKRGWEVMPSIRVVKAKELNPEITGIVRKRLTAKVTLRGAVTFCTKTQAAQPDLSRMELNLQCLLPTHLSSPTGGPQTPKPPAKDHGTARSAWADR